MYLFAAGLDVPLLGHLSTPMLVAIGVAIWWFWPQLSQGSKPQEPPASPRPGRTRPRGGVSPRRPPPDFPAQLQAYAAPLQIAAPIQPAPTPEPTPPSITADFAALERLLADRDKLHAEVTQAMARAKALIDKEAAATVAAKP